ncbi:hypothetical protein BSPWISOXPB_6314 [uncultured Gammaproteobacteria bacterium]|nr:hypothetical protein BSPWISOXPB_6314 [uncultured Gammaproteobacteria bacterium]
MIRLICLGIIKLGMPVCMGVNPTLFMAQYPNDKPAYLIAEPNAVSNISWGWIVTCFWQNIVQILSYFRIDKDIYKN